MDEIVEEKYGICTNFVKTLRRHYEILKKFPWWPSCQESEMNTRHAFYEELKPYWIGLKILGMLPYSVNESGDIKSKFRAKITLKCIIVLTIISLGIYYILFETIKRIKEKEDIDDFMLGVFFFYLTITHTIIPFTHWIQMDTFVATCKAWKCFQEKYEMLMRCPLPWKVTHKLMTELLCAIIGFSFAVCVIFFGLNFQQFIEYWAYCYVIVFSVLHIYILLEQSSNIIIIAGRLKRGLIEVIIRETFDEIPERIQLWFSLSKLVHYLGKLFYKMHMHFIVLFFCLATFSTYRLIKSVTLDGISRSSVLPLSGIYIGILGLFTICECGESVTWEVGNKFKQELIDLKFSTRDLSGKQNLQEFIDCISQNPPIVHLNRYMTINRKLFTTLLTLGATYVFIAFQFSLSTPHESPSSLNNSSQVFSNDSTQVFSNSSFELFSNDSSQSQP